MYNEPKPNNQIDANDNSLELGIPNSKSMFLTPTTRTEILTVIMNLKNKYGGVDGKMQKF